MKVDRFSSLDELQKGLRVQTPPDWHVRFVRSELNGGKTKASDLECLGIHPEATALTISGLDQDAFEFLVNRFGSQFTAIHFWKCPRIADLSPIESMPQLTHLAFHWNQSADRMWNFKKTPTLRGFSFDNFIKLKELADLSDANSLNQLSFGDALFDRTVVQSLEPLATLSQLRSLVFNAKSVLDGRIKPLAALTQLRDLDFPSKLFTTDQLAWLRARLPPTVVADVLQPYRRLHQPVSRGSKMLDVQVCGKGKPLLSSESDTSRLERYCVEFRELVEYYSMSP